MKHWYYLQLFLHQGSQPVAQPQQLVTLADTLLVDYVRRWIETLRRRAWIEQYFFIRYAEGGYHVRLRVQGEAQTLKTQVQPYLQRAVAGFYAEHAAALGLQPEISFSRLQETGYVCVSEYEPEYAKYGGVVGMPLAEAHFEVSSEVALMVIAAAGGVVRAQYALDLIQLMLQAYTGDVAEHAFMLKGYTAYWLAQIPPAEKEQLNAIFENHFQKQRQRFARRLRRSLLQSHWPAAVPHPASRWHEHLSAHIPRLKQLDRQGKLTSPLHLATQLSRQLFPTICETPTVGLLLLPNYIHMLCNRLGLSVIQEAQLAYLTYRTIETEQAAEIEVGPVRLELNTYVQSL